MGRSLEFEGNVTTVEETVVQPAPSARRTRRILLLAVGLLTAGTAQADFYVAAELGVHGAPDMLLQSGDTDRASRCDEFVNPRFREVEGCTTSARGDGAVDDWLSRFDGARGFVAAGAVGLRLNRWRVELELLHRNTRVDQSTSILSSEGTAFTQIFGAELPQASETIDNLTSRNVFANVYLDWPNPTPLTPFAGIGVGIAFADLDYAALWQRSSDPADVDSARGLPNEDEVRRNLAGTVSRAADQLRDKLRGYQLLAGVDYQLSDNLTLTLQGRLVRFAAFEDGGVYDLLRSHVSGLRRDGSEPVRYRVQTDDTGFLAVGLRLRKRF